MNNSGKPVRAALQYFRASPADCLVVHDDLERAVGKVSVKGGGGAAGHNGLRSLTQCLSTDCFPRARVGIGRPADRGQVATYVLEPFTPDEAEALRTTCAHQHTSLAILSQLLCLSLISMASGLLLKCCASFSYM
jgi:PTH1 family peptidyl-tRNA hydrolase